MEKREEIKLYIKFGFFIVCMLVLIYFIFTNKSIPSLENMFYFMNKDILR
jgi:hypothetical protein